MSAPLSGKFQDHYKVLGIDPDAESGTVQDAYSKLSALYHANNRETADKEKYDAVTLAFEVLADPVGRKAFDELRAGPAKESAPRFQADEFFQMLDAEVLRRQTILCLLYDRRRQNPLRPSLSLKQMEILVDSTPEEIQFSVWYLKQKGYAVSDDKSNTQIAVPGMDYLDENPPKREEILGMLRAPAEPAPSAPKPAPVATKAVQPTPMPAPSMPEPPPQRAAASSPFAVPGPAAVPSNGATRQTLNLPRRTIVIPPRAG